MPRSLIVPSDSRSSTSSNRSTGLKNHAVQVTWLSEIRRLGIRWATLTETRTAKEAQGLGTGLCMTVPDYMDAWADMLEMKDMVSPGQVRSLAREGCCRCWLICLIVQATVNPFLNTIHHSLHAFITVDVELSEENAWTRPAMGLFEAIFIEPMAVVSE